MIEACHVIHPPKQHQTIPYRNFVLRNVAEPFDALQSWPESFVGELVLPLEVERQPECNA